MFLKNCFIRSFIENFKEFVHYSVVLSLFYKFHEKTQINMYMTN